MENEIKQIIADYKEELAEAGCEYARQSAMESAFKRILEIVEANDDK